MCVGQPCVIVSLGWDESLWCRVTMPQKLDFWLRNKIFISTFVRSFKVVLMCYVCLFFSSKKVKKQTTEICRFSFWITAERSADSVWTCRYYTNWWSPCRLSLKQEEEMLGKFMYIFHNCWAVIVICNESDGKISITFKTKAKQKYLDWRSLLDSTVQCFSTRGGIYFKIVIGDNIWGCAGYYDVVVITKCGIFLARFITGNG